MGNHIPRIQTLLIFFLFCPTLLSQGSAGSLQTRFNQAIELHKGGNSVQATSLLEGMFKEDLNPVQTRNLKTTLARLYLESGRFQDSLMLLEEVVDHYKPSEQKDVLLLITRARSGLEDELGAWRDLQNLAYLYPGDELIVRERMNQALKMNKLAQARELLKKLQEISPSQDLKDLQNRLNNREARVGDYVETYSSSFHLKVPASSYEDLMTELLPIMEEEAYRLNDYFSFTPKRLVRVLLLESSDYQSEHHQSLPKLTLGVSDSQFQEIRIPLSKFRSPNLSLPLFRKVIAHEYVHHILRILAGPYLRIPVWFHEGLAQLLESTTIDLSNLMKKLRPLAGSVPDISRQAVFHTRPEAAYAFALLSVYNLSQLGKLNELLVGISKFKSLGNFDDIFTKSLSVTTDSFLTSQEKLLEKFLARGEQ